MVYDRSVFDPKYPVFGLFFRRYAPFKKFGGINPTPWGTGVLGNFAGDNRGPLTSLKVSSRTYGCVMFNRFGVGYSFAGSSGTHFHPALFWDTITATAKTKFTLVRSTLTGPDLFGFKASTAASNPLVKPSPDINTFVDVTVNFAVPQRLTIRAQAFGDYFPNLEVFLLCFRSARTALLIDGRTPLGPDAGPFSLPGTGEYHDLGYFSGALALDQKGELAANTISFGIIIAFVENRDFSSLNRVVAGIPNRCLPWEHGVPELQPSGEAGAAGERLYPTP